MVCHDLSLKTAGQPRLPSCVPDAGTAWRSLGLPAVPNSLCEMPRNGRRENSTQRDFPGGSTARVPAPESAVSTLVNHEPRRKVVYSPPRTAKWAAVTQAYPAVSNKGSNTAPGIRVLPPRREPGRALSPRRTRRQSGSEKRQVPWGTHVLLPAARGAPASLHLQSEGHPCSLHLQPAGHPHPSTCSLRGMPFEPGPARAFALT